MRILFLLLTLLIINPLLAQDEKQDTYILITNVNVWDGTSDKTVKADVLVENNLISWKELTFVNYNF